LHAGRGQLRNQRFDAAEQFRIPLSTLNQKIKRLNIEIRKKGRD